MPSSCYGATAKWSKVREGYRRGKADLEAGRSRETAKPEQTVTLAENIQQCGRALRPARDRVALVKLWDGLIERGGSEANADRLVDGFLESFQNPDDLVKNELRVQPRRGVF